MPLASAAIIQPVKIYIALAQNQAYYSDMDLNKIPKQFCDNVTVAYSAEYFVLALLAGQNLGAYSFTPQHAKRLMQYLSYNVENYERSFGEIHAQWVPGVESPIQMIDLNKPKDQEGKDSK